jgi:DNA-binding transcriptional MerR regulator
MSQPTEPDLPLHEPEEHAAYSIEIAARLAGVNTETILHYQEQGLIRTSSADSDKPQLDDEALRTLRQIEHLRETCKVNDNGLRLILGLMDELEHLRRHLRDQR